MTKISPLGEESLPSSQLAANLDAIGVFFLQSDTGTSPTLMSPPNLLIGLATSHEARLRLARIPLLLRHPEFSVVSNSP